jgi:hypothetical protein
MLLLKLSKRFTLDGVALSGYPVVVSVAGGNTPAAVFGSATGSSRIKGDLETDSTGLVECYVRPGSYRMTVKGLGNEGTVSVQDPVVPSGDGVEASGDTGDSAAPFTAQAYAATITPALTGDETVIVVAALTGAMTVAAPAGTVADQEGKRLTFLFAQDGTGGRAVTWNAAFVKAADSGSGASTRAATTYVCDGVKWVQIGGAMTFR